MLSGEEQRSGARVLAWYRAVSMKCNPACVPGSRPDAAGGFLIGTLSSGPPPFEVPSFPMRKV
jgi:hypothetical protein